MKLRELFIRMTLFMRGECLMRKTLQVSESLELGILLAFSGGFMDAYSYIERGKVFANAQTGNMLLLGIHISEGHYQLALCYFFPVFAFAFGIALAELVRTKQSDILHWRQISVFIEAIILLIVSFFPNEYNLLANSLTSLACGIQVETFRKIHGQGIATTMCIGNLRSGTENMYLFFQNGDLSYLKKGLLYFGIIICFILGAVFGNVCIRQFHTKAIIGCSLILLCVCFIMFYDREKKNNFS